MTDEELIEKAAKAMADWRGEEVGKAQRDAASIALAVFREHTETEDEHKSGHTAASARVVPNDPVTSACASGYCTSGCSHMMWKCDTCQCEGGWGAPVGRLEDFVAEHVCPEDTAPTDDEREALASAWAKYRKDVQPNPAHAAREVVAFKAGFESGSRRGAPAEPAVPFKGEGEPIAINPILRGVDLALDRLVRQDCFTERTLRILDDLRAEVIGSRTPDELRAHYRALSTEGGK